MSGHNFSRIPPPYPDPRKWSDVRRLQEHQQGVHWMTSRLYDGVFPFPSNSNRMQYPSFPSSTQRREFQSSSSTPCSTYSNPTSFRENHLTYSSQNCHQNSLQPESNIDHINEANVVTDINSNPQNEEVFYEEEGEEVETLELNDFWIRRLSQTMKRIKKKYKKRL